MNKELRLRTSSQETLQMSKKIRGFVLTKTPWSLSSVKHQSKRSFYFSDYDKSMKEKFPGVEKIEIVLVEALSYGWLVYKVFADNFIEDGSKLEDIFQSQTEVKREESSRSTYIKCKSIKKGQTLLRVEITRDDGVIDYLIISRKRRIIPCKFCELRSSNWNGKSLSTIGCKTLCTTK